MLAHPVVWVGGLASAAYAVFDLIEQAPVLNRVSMTLAWTMAPLAVSVALVAGWAVLRARGRTDAHPPVIMPVAMSQRTGGILGGLLWPALATLILQLVLLGCVFTRDPVTSLVWTELLVGPLYVVFAGAVGAAATRWFPHPATPLLTVLLLAGLQFAVPYDPDQWGAHVGPAALAPIAWPEDIIPYEVSFRPSGLHLGYLVGLVLGVVGLAVISRRVVGWAVLAFGIMLAATSGIAQLGPIEESQRMAAMARLVGDQADLTCETHTGIRYCAMPGYQGWIDDWVRAAAPLVAVVPPETLTGMEVRQYPIHNTYLLDSPEGIDWWWVEPVSEDYASREVVPTGSMQLVDGGNDLVRYLGNRIMGCEIECDGEGQQVIALWLMAHDPDIRSYVMYDARESDYASVSDCMVADLWDQPDDLAVVQGNWGVLTAPGTTYEEAGALLGVSVPAGYDEIGILDGGCP